MRAQSGGMVEGKQRGDTPQNARRVSGRVLKNATSAQCGQTGQLSQISVNAPFDQPFVKSKVNS